MRKLCGKRRFTLAHECAHQLLFHLESEDTKAACRKLYAERRTYSLRDLKSNEDWNEWQANVLGAAILMASAKRQDDCKHDVRNIRGIQSRPFNPPAPLRIFSRPALLGIQGALGGVGMKKNIRIQEPSQEMQQKIVRARMAIASQKERTIKCPYCLHNAITVYEDTRGHVEAKCKKCGRITVFNVLSMRRLRHHLSK